MKKTGQEKWKSGESAFGRLPGSVCKAMGLTLSESQVRPGFKNQEPQKPESGLEFCFWLWVSSPLRWHCPVIKMTTGRWEEWGTPGWLFSNACNTHSPTTHTLIIIPSQITTAYTTRCRNSAGQHLASNGFRQISFKERNPYRRQFQQKGPNVIESGVGQGIAL